MSDSLQLVDEMLKLSSEMVNAAVANDWDTLVELEHRLASQRVALSRLEPGGAQADPLDESALSMKASKIAQILANDATVRQHVAPWMDSARKLLADGSRDRAVRRAYGTLSP
ncbi:MAG TPA: flagellar protein FliT [Azoarcus taiwanensis]|nr:flagellar protein FliT [Azoarcus taiwanensis]